MKRWTQMVLVGSAFAVAALAPREAQAAKQWDKGEAIEFTMDGADDPMPASNVGANGIQTRDFTVTRFHDKDHWIDPDESEPNNEGSSEEDLPYSDIDYSPIYSSDDPGSGGLKHDGATFTYMSPEVGGFYTLKFTGTDRSQAIGRDETGDRHDVDNTDNWWDIDPNK